MQMDIWVDLEDKHTKNEVLALDIGSVKMFYLTKLEVFNPQYNLEVKYRDEDWGRKRKLREYQVLMLNGKA